MKGLEFAARNSVIIGIILGSVGIIISTVIFTGATLRMAVLMVQAAGGSLFLLMIFAGVASIILGMGVPAIASYVVLAVTVAPALVQFGVPAIGAQLFILYWGISHMITPPVGGTLFVVASFTGVDLWKQGYYTMKLGIATFMVPFLFSYHPALLMIGGPAQIVLQFIVAAITMFCIAASFIGYLIGQMNLLQRLFFLYAAVAFVMQTTLSVSTGIVLFLITIIWQWVVYGRRKVPI